MPSPENDRTHQQYFTKGHDLLRKAVRDFVKLVASLFSHGIAVPP